MCKRNKAGCGHASWGLVFASHWRFATPSTGLQIAHKPRRDTSAWNCTWWWTPNIPDHVAIPQPIPETIPPKVHKHYHEPLIFLYFFSFLPWLVCGWCTHLLIYKTCTSCHQKLEHCSSLWIRDKTIKRNILTLNITTCQKSYEIMKCIQIVFCWYFCCTS